MKSFFFFFKCHAQTHTCSSPCVAYVKKALPFSKSDKMLRKICIGPPCKIFIIVMTEMNEEFRTYATDTGTQDLQEHITEYKH